MYIYQLSAEPCSLFSFLFVFSVDGFRYNTTRQKCGYMHNYDAVTVANLSPGGAFFACMVICFFFFFAFGSFRPCPVRLANTFKLVFLCYITTFFFFRSFTGCLLYRSDVEEEDTSDFDSQPLTVVDF